MKYINQEYAVDELIEVLESVRSDTRKIAHSRFDYKIENPLTSTAQALLVKLDNVLVGTYHYMGITYFWAHEYRHILRDNSKYWVKIHTDFLNAGLKVYEYSAKHLEIIKRYINVTELDEISAHCKNTHGFMETCNEGCIQKF